MEFDSFLNGICQIRVTTEVEFKTVIEYYHETYGVFALNTVNLGNWRDYPILYCSGKKAIHGRGGRTGKTIEFGEWLDQTNVAEIDESDKPLSFLFA